MTITGDTEKRLKFNFLPLSTLFFFSLWHKVLYGNKLKRNCFKLVGARHLPKSTFPWSAFYIPVTLPGPQRPSRARAGPRPWAELGRLLQLWTEPVLCRGYTKGAQNAKGRGGGVAEGMFELCHLTDGHWEGKARAVSHHPLAGLSGWWDGWAFLPDPIPSNSPSPSITHL